MKRCLVCTTPIEQFLSFPKMPIANHFLSASDFRDELFFNLDVGFCPECKMVQLTDLVDKEKMFNENYAFFSSTSQKMSSHFKEFADYIINNYLIQDNPFIVEIGCNDGIMLKYFHEKNIRHLGVEPSANVAQAASEKGLDVVARFFDQTLAEEIVAEHGQADAILGANVMCHISDIHSVLSAMKRLLKPGGVIVFEDPYWLDILNKTSYDQIYDEHAFYFSITSVVNLFQPYGFQLIDALPQNVHGGSMRYVLSSRDDFPSHTKKVQALLDREIQARIQNIGTYFDFHQRIEKSKSDLIALLSTIKNEGKRIVGYGATSKSTTVLNYCGIGPDLVDYISDTTPIKQGKFSPGMHIPIKPYHEFKENYPDYALLFAWNHLEEIFAKERKFLESGGKWIVYVPDVKVIEA